MRRFSICLLSSCVLAAGLTAGAARAQTPAAPAAGSAGSGPSADPLGRETPRGTVTGFLEAARAGNLERAAQYLNVRGRDTQALARQLFVVLDARLPPPLMRISSAPGGSGTGASVNQEIVGTIEGSTSPHTIVLERVIRDESPPIWLFSRSTLEAIPPLHDEIVNSAANGLVPRFLVDTRIGGLRLIDVVALLVGLPFLYLITVLLNRLLTAFVRLAFSGWTRGGRNVLPAPARLLLVVIVGSALIVPLPLSLVARQLWSTIASLLTSISIAWLLILANAEAERHLFRRIAPTQAPAAASLLRLLRRAVDVLIVFAVVIVTLRHFGIDPTPALAGLGVGGIAVALAAQKTLENVIAGASLIFDKAVRVGDFLKMGQISGTVDHIGLRSTRIRTLDRTIVSVPNSQIANASLETMSARDKFWFHPVVGLVYETTPEQLHRVIDDIRQQLCDHPLVDLDSVRVRLVRLGAFSLDIEVVAYFLARDWAHFLELQEQLLGEVMEIVNRSGTAIAFPSQTMYVTRSTTSAEWPISTT